jgi:lipopolysaccharide transport system ATP-binding protein
VTLSVGDNLQDSAHCPFERYFTSIMSDETRENSPLGECEPSSVGENTLDGSIAVALSHVSKMYRLYGRPIDVLKQHMLGRFGKSYGREFWALREVSFAIKPGEIFGVIGRNGSGKSTLLQILAGILKPTNGQVHVNGRVSALLELGSGFNPEYSGRENVFMSGAILGVSRSEMEERFEEIASFADIGEFMDCPVKTYSSGMFARLAFAVSISLDPDVLLVDEVLAVGDIFFRQKCYKRLKKLIENGVAVVLVSHAMNDVRELCKRALVLDHGKSVFLGSSTEAVNNYYLLEQQGRLDTFCPEGKQQVQDEPLCQDTTAGDFLSWPNPEAFLDISTMVQVSNGWARCTAVALCDKLGQSRQTFEQGETASFFYEFEIFHDIQVPIVGVVLQNDKGVIVHGKSTLEYGSPVPMAVKKGDKLRCRQDIDLEIMMGEYTAELGLAVITRGDYETRTRSPYSDLSEKLVGLCHLQCAVHFAVVFRNSYDPVQLLHHGIANLPGTCQVMVETSA